jgi:hypothetical protein
MLTESSARSKRERQQVSITGIEGTVCLAPELSCTPCMSYIICSTRTMPMLRTAVLETMSITKKVSVSCC